MMRAGSRHSIQPNIGDAALRQALVAIHDAVRDAGGRALLVGGSVRDAALRLPAKDLDIEVYGIAAGRLRDLLATRFGIDLTGESFAVIKIKGLPIDISIPRRESKAGLGHRGFDILSDPSMTPQEAAARRDFTINAIALDLADGELIDPYGGLNDLEQRLLRHTTEKFAEDPLRVLRGMQLAARFDLEVASGTVTLCRGIEPEGLACERIFEEWRKLILNGIKPSRGLTFLRECQWVQYFPEVEALIGCNQEPEWHPEGDVWTHTLHSMDAFATERTGDDWEDLVVGLAVLCHDLGKPSTTEFQDGRIRSKGHEEAGEAPTRSFLGRLTNQSSIVEAVVPLVRDHLSPGELFKAKATDRAVRRLAHRVGRIDRLVRVARADHMGRPPIKGDSFPAGEWLLERARALNVERGRPRPIVMGRHLVELGLIPGPHFGPILNTCYEGQIEGAFSTLEEGIEYARLIVAQ